MDNVRNIILRLQGVDAGAIQAAADLKAGIASLQKQAQDAEREMAQLGAVIQNLDRTTLAGNDTFRKLEMQNLANTKATMEWRGILANLSPAAQQAAASVGTLNKAHEDGLTHVTNFGRGLAAGTLSMIAFGGAAYIAGRIVGDTLNAALKQAGELQKEVSVVGAIRPDTNEPQLYTQLSQAGPKVGESAEQIGKALERVDEAFNLTQQASVDLATQIAGGAAANRQAVEAWTSNVIGAVQAYGGSVQDVAHAEDVLTTILQQAGGSRKIEADRFSELADSASLVGTSLESVGAAMIVLTQHGGNTTKEMQGLRMALESLGTEKVQQDLEALGISVKDSHGNLKDLIDIIILLQERFKGLSAGDLDAQLAKVFSGRNTREAVEALIAGTDTLIQKQGQLVDSAGAIQAAQEKWLSSPAGRLEVAKQSWNELLQSVGQYIQILGLAPLISGNDVPSGLARQSGETRQEYEKRIQDILHGNGQIIESGDQVATSTTQNAADFGVAYAHMGEAAMQHSREVIEANKAMIAAQTAGFGPEQAYQSYREGERDYSGTAVGQTIDANRAQAEAAKAAAEAQQTFSRFAQDQSATEAVKRAQADAASTTEFWTGKINQAETALKALQNTEKVDVYNAHQQVIAAQNELARITEYWTTKIDDADKALKKAQQDERDALAYIQPFLDQIKAAIQTFDNASAAALHEFDVQLHDLQGQLDALKTADANYMQPYIDSLNHAKAVMQDLTNEATLMHQHFADQMYEQQQAMYELQQRERATMDPLNAAVKGYSDQLEGERRAAAEVAWEYSRELIPLQRELNALKAADVQAEHLKTLHDEQLAIGNLVGRINQLAPGSRERVNLENQMAEATAKRARQEREFNLEDRISAIDRERQSKADAAAVEQHYTELALQGAQDRQKAAQEEFNKERQVISDREAAIQHEQTVYDHAWELRRRDAQAELDRAQYAYGVNKEYTDANEKLISDQITAIGKLRATKAWDDSETRRGLVANQSAIQAYYNSVNDYYNNSATGIVPTLTRTKQGYQDDATEAEKSQTRQVKAAQTLEQQISDYYNNPITGIIPLQQATIDHYKTQATDAETSANNQVKSLQKTTDAIKTQWAWYDAVEKKIAAGGTFTPEETAVVIGNLPPGYTMQGGQIVPKGTAPTGGTQSPVTPPRSVPAVPPSHTGEGYTGYSGPTVIPTGRGGVSMGPFVIQMGGINAAMNLGPGDARQPAYWVPYADAIVVAITQKFPNLAAVVGG